MAGTMSGRISGLTPGVMSRPGAPGSSCASDVRGACVSRRRMLQASPSSSISTLSRGNPATSLQPSLKADIELEQLEYGHPVEVPVQLLEVVPDAASHRPDLAVTADAPDFVMLAQRYRPRVLQLEEQAAHLAQRVGTAALGTGLQHALNQRHPLLRHL